MGLTDWNDMVWPAFTVGKLRILDSWFYIAVLQPCDYIYIKTMIFGRPRATETYCRNKTDPMALSGVSDFVADYEIGEVENGCSGKDGL